MQLAAARCRRKILHFHSFWRKNATSALEWGNHNYSKNLFGKVYCRIFVRISHFTALLLHLRKTKFLIVYPTIYLPNTVIPELSVLNSVLIVRIYLSSQYFFVRKCHLLFTSAAYIQEHFRFDFIMEAFTMNPDPGSSLNLDCIVRNMGYLRT